MEIRYKVVYKVYGQWLNATFHSLQCAYEYSDRMNGIVLNAK